MVSGDAPQPPLATVCKSLEHHHQSVNVRQEGREGGKRRVRGGRREEGRGGRRENERERGGRGKEGG